MQDDEQRPERGPAGAGRDGGVRREGRRPRAQDGPQSRRGAGARAGTPGRGAAGEHTDRTDRGAARGGRTPAGEALEGGAPRRGRPTRPAGASGGAPQRGRGPQGARVPAEARGTGRPGDARAPRRPQTDRPRAPELPEDVTARDLDRAARARLRTLSRENADVVARHLVMAGRLLEEDPELAYQHAAEAVRRAGRVDVVREAAGITAYRTGRYAEALRELRTARRLGGSDDHVPLMADCERGLGRPERAIALAAEHAGALPTEVAVELAIVVSGARLDLGQPEAALAALSTGLVRTATGELGHRVAEAKATALSALGREDEAAALLATLPQDEDEPVVVIDLEDEVDDAEAPEAVVEAAPEKAAPEEAEPEEAEPEEVPTEEAPTEEAALEDTPAQDADRTPEEEQH